MRIVTLAIMILVLLSQHSSAQLGITGPSQVTVADGDTVQVGLTYYYSDSVSRSILIKAVLMDQPPDSLTVLFIPQQWTITPIPAIRGSHGMPPSVSYGAFGVSTRGAGRTGGLVYSAAGYNYLFSLTAVRAPGVRLSLNHNIRIGTPDSMAVLRIQNVRSDTQTCKLSIDTLGDAHFALSHDSLLLPPNTSVEDTIYYTSSAVRKRMAQIHCHSFSAAGDSIQSIGITGEKTLGIHIGTLSAEDTGTVEVSIDTLTTVAVRLKNEYRDSITLTSVSTTPYINWFEWLNDSLFTLAPDSTITIHIRRYFDILKSYPPIAIVNIRFGVGFRFSDSLTADNTIVLPTRFTPFNQGYEAWFGAGTEPLHFVYCTPYSPPAWDWALCNMTQQTFIVDTVSIRDAHFHIYDFTHVVFPQDSLRIRASIAGTIGNYYSTLILRGHLGTHDTTFAIPVAFGLNKAVASVSTEVHDAVLAYDAVLNSVNFTEHRFGEISVTDILGRTILRSDNTDALTLPKVRPVIVRGLVTTQKRAVAKTLLLP